ncbi:hypothetical protein NDU88_000618 [Pleurodeles waltl]|uniref:Uncharacterized protein n=1 Tax=Pleurodeles waltl TaxID=8319 RepID=A0AAV7TFD3_PLEWA|nr:hypothetical protein NDU88_000618 [Pleurodeles waltl]
MTEELCDAHTSSQATTISKGATTHRRREWFRKQISMLEGYTTEVKEKDVRAAGEAEDASRSGLEEPEETHQVAGIGGRETQTGETERHLEGSLVLDLKEEKRMGEMEED